MICKLHMEKFLCHVIHGGDRKVLVWGRCDYGQLGLPGNCQNDKHRCCWRPHEIPHLKGAQQVCTGYCSLSVCNKESYIYTITCHTVDARYGINGAHNSC